MAHTYVSLTVMFSAAGHPRGCGAYGKLGVKHYSGYDVDIRPCGNFTNYGATLCKPEKIMQTDLLFEMAVI